MNKLIGVAVLLFAATAHSQVIDLWPTNYTKTTFNQNNLSKLEWWPSWVTATTDTDALSNRTLVSTHAVYFDDVELYGSRWVAPKLQETRYISRQIGAVTYRPQFIYEIDWGHVGTPVTNSWRWDAPDFQWKPNFIGLRVTGNNYWRVVEHGTQLACWSHNISRMPTLLTVPCASRNNTVAFNYRCRFEPEQTKYITFNLADAVFQLNLNNNLITIDHFEIDIDNYTDEPLPR